MPEKINSSKMTSSSKCSCCPYGFHIDRDFVRFCDTLYNAAQLDKLRQHKRERRKEKKSVESYLGIGNVAILPKEKVTSKIATLPHDFYLHSDEGLKDAVNDFEDTWKRSLKKSSSSNDIAEKPNGFYSLRKKPSVLSNFHSFAGDKKDILCSSDASKSRSSSTSSVSSQSTTISNFNGLVTYDASNYVLAPDHITATTIGSFSKPFTVKSGSGIQKSVLTNIREQMASSLLRLKDLEEQVKCIPILQVKLSALKEEKKSLINQLKFNQNSIQKETLSTKQNNLEIQLKRLENQGIMSPTLTRKCLSTLQSESNLSSPGMASCLDAAISKKCFFEKETISQIKFNEQKGKETSKVMKSIGTSCSVLTRDIGIGYVPSKFKSIAVGCDTLPSDSLYSYKSNKSFDKYVNLSSESLESDLESFGGSDEQYKPSLHINKASKNSITKSIHYKNFADSSTSMDIIYFHKSTNTDIVPSAYNSVERAFMKSSSSKFVQTSELKTFKNKCLQTLPDSSKSESSKFNFKRDVAIGDFDINETICSGCKKIKKSIAVGNFDVKISDCEKCHKQSNSPNKCNKPLSRTKTIGIGDLDINFDVCKNCEQIKCGNLVNVTKTNSIGINTINDSLFTNLATNSDIHICDKCSATIHSVARGLAANTNDSKIPRSNVKSSPPSKSSNAAKLPKLKIPVYKSPRNDDKDDKSSNNTQIKKDCKKEESIISLQLENQTVTMKETKLSIQTQEERKDKSESFDELPTLMNLAATSRKKVEISKEIKAACKVLNDCLQKSDKRSEKKALSSLGIIQNEWFRVANQKNADPLLIEDYLDFFEEFSKLLLQRVVNLSDNNGNTALHYAVSYGNFDVVSILIDSKVCDVNKKNKAGYTSIMLVALAEMKNDAHQYVVQRLFGIGDINIKATQNGQTALMLAVSHGKKEIAKILIDAGAEVNLQDKDGSTALMCAAEHGHLEIVKILLSHPECDPSIVDNDDCNALTIAMEAGHKDIGLLIYTNMNFSRGSSPYSTLKSRKRSTPPPRTPTLRTPPLPSPSARSTNSIPSSFHFST